jgi:hypothetical protein
MLISKETGRALYFVFCFVLLFGELTEAGPLGQLLYDAFVIANLINLVRILRKPSNSQSCGHQDAR